MHSYTEISDKKIHNAPELFAARYDSWILKDFVSLVWIVTLGVMLVSVLKVIVSVAAYFLETSEKVCLAFIVTFLVLATILVDNRLMGVIKTGVFIAVIITCLTLIVLIFHEMDVYVLLDNYRRADLSGGTSVYLNMLYYDGDYISVGSAVSMVGVGIGCIAMPLMYKGVITIRGVKELDAGRIWAVVFEGFTILSSCALALLVVPVLYPETISSDMNSFQVYNLLMKKLLGHSTYAYLIRAFMLMIFILAVVVMLESFMRNICEHIRGLIPSTKASPGVKLLMDIGVVVLTGVLIFLIGEFASYNREYMIVSSWGMCASALAGPLIFTLMYRNSTKAGMYAGILSGIAAFTLWQFTDFFKEMAVYDIIGTNGDVVGFCMSSLMCFAVSLFTKKNAADELAAFDRMRQDQA